MQPQKYHIWIFCDDLMTNPHRLRAVSVCVSTGLVWRWEGCRLADDHRVHAGGVSGRGWRGGWEQQVGLGLLTQTVVVQRPRRVCVLQGLRVLILRIWQQWAFCLTWNQEWQMSFHKCPNKCLWLPTFFFKWKYFDYFDCDHIIIMWM